MPNLPKNSEQFICIHEAAQILGVANKTLRRWEDPGKLVPQTTKGGHRRYSLQAVKEYKAGNHKKNSIPKAPAPLATKTLAPVRQIPLRTFVSSESAPKP